jgi:hypothetical protein
MSRHKRPIFERNMHDALRSWHERGGRGASEPAIVDVPFDELLLSVGDNLDGEAGDYEWRQRILGAKLVFRWILAEGFHPLKIMKRLFAVGRAMNIAPFSELTMTEQGKMFSEERATVSWRMKVLSGLIKLQGMRGHRLAGQKTERASQAAREVALGNHHRNGIGKNGQPVGAKARQSSFLRKLRVAPTTPHP